MSSINRRHFLQFAGSTLAAMGLSQVEFLTQADRYGKVLAQSTSRKLALLVGINAYSRQPLSGCLTDVALQRELLIHRYGFKSTDIVELRDQAATRRGIIDAFEQHLIQQAKPGDVVVFHYSGHGCKVADPDPNPGRIQKGEGFNGAIVPVDANASAPGTIRAIMGHTLFLLTAALQTENVTMVLDSCFSGGGLRGNTRIRAFRSPDTGENDAVWTINPEEFADQQRLLSKLNLSPQAFIQQRKAGIAKGIAMGGASPQQYSTDAPEQIFGHKVTAGVFTYVLTQYLWQQGITQPIEQVFEQLQLGTEVIQALQLPVYEAKQASFRQKPIYFLDSGQPSAEAVINQTPKNNQEISLWLGGVSAKALRTYDGIVVYNLLNQRGAVVGQIQQTNRDGFQAVGKLLPGAKVSQVSEGMLLQQQIRGMPTNLTLRVGLDASLGNDLATAQKLLQSVGRVEVVPVKPDQQIDYLLGRMTAKTAQQLSTQKQVTLPPENTLCLFSFALVPIADSWGAAGEPIETAVRRLTPKLKSLLAGRILQAVLGSDASSLRVSAEITPSVAGVTSESRVVQSRGAQQSGGSRSLVNTVQAVKAGANLQIQLRNDENQPLFVALLVISDSGDLTPLYPIGEESAAALIPKRSKFSVPVPITVSGPSGFFELMMVASKEELKDALTGINQIARSRGLKRGEPTLLEGDEPLSVVGRMIGDIDRMSRAGAGRALAVDSDKLAVLSTVFQVVD